MTMLLVSLDGYPQGTTTDMRGKGRDVPVQMVGSGERRVHTSLPIGASMADALPPLMGAVRRGRVTSAIGIPTAANDCSCS